jgi:membrane-associated protease RseP (regulator of RpoE activity)
MIPMSTELPPYSYTTPTSTVTPEYVGLDSPAEYRPPARRRVVVPLVLFLLTIASTYMMGGLAYSLPLMITLGAHELGHFLQARYYGVPASLPYFLPMPLSPIGTMGAVIAMHPGMGNRRSLFDIAISGPLAGLVPAVAFSAIGLSMSEVTRMGGPGTFSLGEPLLFRWLSLAIFGPLPAGHDVLLHPVAFAGWVGIFITALNLIPISQLDGGHMLYALLRRKAHVVATLLLVAAAIAIVAFDYWGWTLMLALLFLMGPNHPPTADDSVPLGAGRVLLGWLTLLFVFVGFTPTPFLMPS